MSKDINSGWILFIITAVIYVVGQFLIGTYDPGERSFIYNAPADVDFLYYGAIINSLLSHFPPENPAFAGVKLTQPFLQFYPAALLGGIVNPYNSIRILNVAYLILFWLVLKRLFPRGYGPALVVLFFCSTFGAAINAPGVDFIARGFTHVPFFILLTLAIFGRPSWMRLSSIVVAALINGYLMLIVIPFFLVITLIYGERIYIYLLAAAIAGTAAAGLFVSSAAAESPARFMFAGALYFDPLEILKHGTPFIIIAFFFRQKQMIVLLAVSIIFGALIHYNPFFPVFMVYYCGAMMLASGEIKYGRLSRLVHLILAVMAVNFLIFTYHKYDPGRMDYHPRFDDRLDDAISWVTGNTRKDAVFMAVTADENDLALIMQYRPTYLGYIGHIAHLGLNWNERYAGTVRAYQTGQIPSGVDYLFYGPVEKKYFPGARPPLKIAYEDSHVIIYGLK
jgi:hypothetical protein